MKRPATSGRERRRTLGTGRMCTSAHPKDEKTAVAMITGMNTGTNITHAVESTTIIDVPVTIEIGTGERAGTETENETELATATTDLAGTWIRTA